MAFKTTHEERVAMLRDETLENMNGMWATLILQGTAEARDAFRAAAEDAGWRKLLFAGFVRDDSDSTNG